MQLYYLAILLRFTSTEIQLQTFPVFWELVLGLGFLLFATMYVGFENGGIMGAISLGFRAIYNLIYGSIFVTYIFAIVAWTFNKWEILVEIGVPVAVFILKLVHIKRRYN